MDISMPVIAGTVSTFFFLSAEVPMLTKAFRTRELASYSIGNIAIANAGNVIHSIYVYSLPPGPIWMLHTFYMVSTALMLLWYLRFEGLPIHFPRPRFPRFQLAGPTHPLPAWNTPGHYPVWGMDLDPAVRSLQVRRMALETVRRSAGKDADMSERNKQLARQVLEEVYSKGDLDTADRIVASDFVGHSPAADVIGNDLDAYKAFVGIMRQAFPDLHFTVEEQIAEGDRVLTRWTASGTHRGEFMGVPPTGRHGQISGMTLDRFADGKLVECWENGDDLGLLQQIGAVPDPQVPAN